MHYLQAWKKSGQAQLDEKRDVRLLIRDAGLPQVQAYQHPSSDSMEMAGNIVTKGRKSAAGGVALFNF